MVVDREIKAVENAKFLAVFGEEVFVAHPLLDLFRVWREAVLARGENVSLAIEPIDSADPLGVHQVGGIPTPRGVEDDIKRAFVALIGFAAAR